MNKEYIAYLLKHTAIMFICSYEDAWVLYMREEEKGGFDFEEIMEEI